MASSRGSTRSVVGNIEDAKRTLELSSLGQNELFKKSEYQKPMPITRTLFNEHGEIVEKMVVSPNTWRELRRNGKL